MNCHDTTISIMDLGEYELEFLRNDGEFTLYRARQASDPAPVLALVAERPAARNTTRLEHEFALAAVLDSSWAARPLALNGHKGSTTLLLEAHGSDPLDLLLSRPLEFARFLRLAVNLAAALGQVHRRGLIHKDVKPAHVLVDAAGNVRLTGFGIASRLPHERQHPAPPEVIAGTFAYMAPEQTGRMNRSIDARSDLYSLGITLYEMLTGALPFTASDPMEWIHCHIARKPAPPSERVSTVPAPVEAIILRLLAKSAEDRYQTAAGVEADLRRCLAEWEAHSRVDPFPLGSHDASDRLRIPEKLYGREGEINAIAAAFDRVVQRGKTELVLVSGYAGVGKSSIVNELHKVLVPQRALFAAGKFDQYKRDIPYATLAQAFQSLVSQLLNKDDAELERWRQALLEALGPSGQLMVNLIPELTLVIGQQPPVPDLPPQDRQTRFQRVFRRFLGVFARPEHPLVLFLDDLQWLDAATLELLVHLASEPEVQHLLLIGAYRDNEVGPLHPLTAMLAAIRNTGGRVQDIVLSPLLPEHVERLVADALHSERESVRPLAELVFQKTAGNPFFAIQFVTALVEEGLLAFDQGALAWRWFTDRIGAKGYADNVLDLMAGKIKRLPDVTQQALMQCACLGHVADFTTLSLLQSQSEEALHASLSDAVQAGLLIRLNDAYAFIHDRVHEAAYALIPEAERAAAHLRIGRLLAAPMSPQEVAENVFDLVNQLNAGVSLMSDVQEKERAAQLNLLAGQKAKASTAYAAAARYLSIGMDLIGSGGWDDQYDLAFTLWIECAECEYLNGNFERTEQLLAELLARARSKVDKAAAYRMQILFHVTKSDYRAAIEGGLECLLLFGIAIPSKPTREQVKIEYEGMWSKLNDRSIESLVDLPLMTDPEQQAVSRVLTGLFAPAVFTNSNLFYMLVCRAANMTFRHGTSEASTHIYSGLAQILGPLFHRYEDGFQFGMLARHIAERYEFPLAKAYFALQNACVWSRPIQKAIDFTRLSFQAATETGDLSYACYCRFRLVTYLLLQGCQLDDVWSEAQQGLEFTRRVKHRDSVDIIIGQQVFIRNMRGATPASSSFDSTLNEEELEARLTENRMPVMVCWYWILKLQARFMSGDFEGARSVARKAEELLWASEAYVQWVDYVFFAALTIAALHDGDRSETSADGLDTLHQHVSQLREWADASPHSFLNRYTLVSAEIARIEGRDLEAMRLYDEAIRLAGEHGTIQNEGLANELASRFYAARGFSTISGVYLRNARDCYLRWGADGKVRQLEQLHPYLRQQHAEARRSGNTLGTPVEQLELATVVRASQAVSSEIDLGKLLNALMIAALEYAGADRGLLIMPRGDELWIEAEATTVRDTVDVHARRTSAAPGELPESILRYTMRSQNSVLLNDASKRNPYSDDPYIRQNPGRSILCLPLIRLTKLIGVLYLENRLTPDAFTPGRITVLKLLASQAANSLENARLYTELRQAQALLAEAQTLSHTGSFGWAAFSDEIFWSEESFRIFGYDPTTKPSIAMVLDRVHPDDVTLVRHVLEHAANYWRGFDFEHRLLMPDGSVKHLHVVAHAASDEPVRVRFVGAVMDITARKQAEAALRESEQRYRQLFRYMPVALLQVNVRGLTDLLKGSDIAGPADLAVCLDQQPEFLNRAMDALVIEEVNERAIQLFGVRDASELVGSVARYWRENPGTLRRAMEGRLRGDLFFQEETKIRTPDGRAVDVLVTIARPDETSALGIGFLGFVDITERVHAQEMVQQLQADFAHAARISMLGELTASISHELTQPLAAITLSAEASLRWIDRPEPDLVEARALTRDMLGDARRAADIIARIRAMATRKATERTQVPLDDVVVEALLFLRHEVQSRAVVVSHQPALGAPKVSADRTQLQQVIVNLAFNAIQAMEQVGTQERKITIRTSVSDPATVRCTIEDSGPGIAPDHLNRLFDSFFTTKEGGMGMGLAICRSIIENHGGQVTADNESIHGGARLCFTLPALAVH